MVDDLKIANIAIAAIAADLGSENGDWCALDETGTVVHFYRENGELFMSMPYEDYKDIIESA